MARPLLMPQVGQDIETAVIVRWLVKEGDCLKQGEVFVEVESEKAAFEVEAEESGTVLKLLYEEGDEVKVLEPIAWVGEPGEKLEDTLISDTGAVRGKKNTQGEKPAAAEETGPGIKKIFAAPAARRLAREHGIDLGTVKGCGPRGRIVKGDVLAVVASGGFSPAAGPEMQKEKQPVVPGTEEVLSEDREIPFSRIRKRIAERLALSKQTIPHFYLFLDVNMSAALDWRKGFNKGKDAKVSVNDIIVKAAASALAGHRALNSHVAGDRLILRKNINIGIAVSTDEGLLVPVIPDADQKTIEEISRVSAGNAQEARRGVLKAGSRGTFTVSNLGMFGVSFFLPIISPPECAILGVGSIEKRAVPGAGSGIDIRDMMTLTLACDHRAVDGACAAKFLNEIKTRLEKADF